MHPIKDIESKYTWGRYISEGNYGTVYEAIRKDTQEIFAIKTVNKKKLEERLDG